MASNATARSVEQSLASVTTSYGAYSPFVLVGLAIFALGFLLPKLPSTSRGNIIEGLPIVGAQWPFEPEWFTKLRFTVQGWSISHEGWTKYRNQAFTVIRPESNITVIPNRYVDELRNVPDDRLAAVEAIVDDLMAKYTGIDVLIGSHLSNTVVRTKLTPRLGSFIPVIEDELMHGLEKEFPAAKGKWETIDLNKVALHVISRITARLFVGFPLCRNQEWLDLNENIVPEIFATVVIMRLFPAWVHPAVAAVLPSRRKLQKCTERIHELLIPVINERRKIQAEGGKLDEDIITWMMELATGEEVSAENLAQRYIYTIIGSMHTVTAAVVDTVYDLCARPDYIQELRDETEQVLQEDGGWTKTTTNKMLKMDSFMKEVQRVNPPSSLGFKRIVKDPKGITLSDGMYLPPNTYICVPTATHLQNEIAPPGEANFDGYRYYKRRMEPRYSVADQYSSTDKNHIHFGHGKYACPGRFVASNEIKMIVGNLLLKYDIKFPQGQGRPANKTILELSFQDPAARIMIKARSS